MTAIAHVHGERYDGAPVARLAGEVDRSNAEEVAARLRSLASEAALIVDLTSTTYLDSAGIDVLFVLAQELRERGSELRIVVASGTPIARVLSIAGVDRAIPAAGSIEDAVAGRR